MNWKKLTAVLSSALLLSFSEQIIHACSDSNQYDNYPSFFGNKAPDKKAYTPFFYVDGYLYYDDWYGDNVNMYDVNKELILKEWQQYSQSNIPLGDIDSVVNKFSIEDMQAMQQGTKGNPQAASNRFALWLTQNKKQNVMSYLTFAKKCELNSGYDPDPWNTKTVISPYTNKQLAEEGITLQQQCKDDFLKMKYNFQILKMTFYEKDYAKTLALYEQLVSGKEDKSIAATRCIGFKAGAYYNTKNKPLAAYLYSKMFDNNDAYKMEAMLSYSWSRAAFDADGRQIHDYDNDIFALCKTDHERAVVTVMNALREYDLALPLIKKAYNLDNSVAGIDVLMNREVNKIEHRYFSNQIFDENKLPYSDNSYYYNIRNYDYTQENRNRDSLKTVYSKYLQQLNAFNDQLIKDGKNGSKSFWYLNRAYLAYMLYDNNQMNAALQSANTNGMQPMEKRLYNVVEILALLRNNKTITTTVEADLLPKLQALNQLAIKIKSADNNYRDIMQHLVAGKYLSQGDTPKAVYAMARALSFDSLRNTFYVDNQFEDIQGDLLDKMSVSSIKTVQNFEGKKDKTPFEKWLVSGTYYSADVLKELEGTKYLRAYNFAEAKKIFEGIKNMERHPNPFLPRISDVIELNKEDTIKTYTKYTFSKRMAELQEIIAKNPKDAGAMFGYAVALYNVSYYGKSNHLFEYFRSHTDGMAYYKGKEWDALPRAYQEYYGVYTAEQYFNKTVMATTDPELKAKAVFGAAKCWEKRCPDGAPGYYEKNDPYYLNALKNPYFVKLRKEYSSTAYYNKVYNTCSYFKDYVRR